MLASTLLADTSTVTEGREAAGKGEVEDPEAGADKNGKGDPGDNAALLNRMGRALVGVRGCGAKGVWVK
ncbi:hypothetical protein Pyn_28247 [Prunus yedoensis var. nudiflora]|uniref:Uncharacterized protein n=1 Tax=Prunus yedoensis var. nudiflora TaxID=2094558 RepID=A0A314YY51_PRUYE|nr:hypothetical protein Pyn_28247 [Prunus yedoensis var. nudiflora]